jgi:hypothetical protein
VDGRLPDEDEVHQHHQKDGRQDEDGDELTIVFFVLYFEVLFAALVFG